MDEFRSSYVKLCRENRLDPQESVLLQLRRPTDANSRGRSSKSVTPRGTTSSGPCLNLSTTSLTTHTCSVLGATLATDHTVVHVTLADCMIGDEGKYLDKLMDEMGPIGILEKKELISQ